MPAVDENQSQRGLTHSHKTSAASCSDEHHTRSVLVSLAYCLSAAGSWL